MCGVDRLGNIYTGLIYDGRAKYTDIDIALSEVVENNSILCTYKHRSYIPFAAQHNFELHQISGGRKTVDIYNIQRVNDFHSSLKRLIRKFNGVLTKFLTNYLFCTNGLNYSKQKWKEISLKSSLFMLIQHILYL